MRKIQDRRAAVAAAETPIQRFERLFKKRLIELYPDEAAKIWTDEDDSKNLTRKSSSFDLLG